MSAIDQLCGDVSEVPARDSNLNSEKSASENDSNSQGTNAVKLDLQFDGATTRKVDKRFPPRKFRKSFIYKSGQRLLKFRLSEISNRQLVRTVGTQSRSPARTPVEVDHDRPHDSSECRNYSSTCPSRNNSDLTLSNEFENQGSVLDQNLMKKELRRLQWRESKRRLRSAYVADPESREQRKRRLQNQKERTELARKTRTESEKIEARRKHQQYKATRLKNENNNQRFWRLIKGRQFRRNGYHNNAIHVRYDRSIGLNGFTQPTFENCTSPSDKFVELQIGRFYYMMKKALSGRSIPENLFTTFAERGIDLPKQFFTDFIEDQEQVELEK